MMPFYRLVVCHKIAGGKSALWHATLNHEGICKYLIIPPLHGAGNTADNAIKDLKNQINKKMKP